MNSIYCSHCCVTYVSITLTKLPLIRYFIRDNVNGGSKSLVKLLIKTPRRRQSVNYRHPLALAAPFETYKTRNIFKRWQTASAFFSRITRPRLSDNVTLTSSRIHERTSTIIDHPAPLGFLIEKPPSAPPSTSMINEPDIPIDGRQAANVLEESMV